jgi:hypothetical protein
MRVGKRNLRKNPIFTVINHFDPYREGFYSKFTRSREGVRACRGVNIFCRGFPRGQMLIYIPIILFKIYRSAVIINMPPSKNPLLTNNFNEGPITTSSKYQVLHCKHCKWTRTNTHRALEHLENCANYAASKTIERLAKRQATLQLGVQTISREKKQTLDSAAALAVYMSAKPFCLWEDKYFRQLISLLSDNLYTPPRGEAIGGDLLDTAYMEVRAKVQSILAEQDSLQFVLDESPDINH